MIFIQKPPGNLQKRLKTNHKEKFIELETLKETHAAGKRKALEVLKQDAKQPKISSCFGNSIVMDACVDLVVTSGRDFKMFTDDAMKTLIKMAKLHLVLSRNRKNRNLSAKRNW